MQSVSCPPGQSGERICRDLSAVIASLSEAIEPSCDAQRARVRDIGQGIVREFLSFELAEGLDCFAALAFDGLGVDCGHSPDCPACPRKPVYSASPDRRIWRMYYRITRVAFRPCARIDISRRTLSGHANRYQGSSPRLRQCCRRQPTIERRYPLD